MAFDLSNISDYVSANEKELLLKAVLNGKTAKMIGLQTGLKGSGYLNNLSSNGTLKAAACTWSPSGTTTFARRKIDTALFDYQEAYCPDELRDTAFGYNVNLVAGKYSIPFEEQIIEENLRNIELQKEQIIWQGDTTLTGTTYLKLTDGFIKILSAESNVIDATISGKTLTGNTKDAIDAIVANIPDELLVKPNVVIFVGTEVYRKAIKAWQDANLYHYNPADLMGNFETIVPGTDIKLVGVYGLKGKNKAYAGAADIFVLGTDLENASEMFTFRYSEDNLQYRFYTKFNLGVQVRFPNQIVEYTA